MKLQLEQVHSENDKKRKEDEAARLEKERTAEIERKVTEQLEKQRKKEAEKAAAEKKRVEAEKARIAEEARKLLEAQQAAERRRKEEEEKKKKEIQDIIDKERQKFEAERRGMMVAAPQPRKTYTKFSKVHLCREALEERQISFTDEVCFLNGFLEESGRANLCLSSLTTSSFTESWTRLSKTTFGPAPRRFEVGCHVPSRDGDVLGPNA
jgi:hypothetical protein